MNKDLPWPEVQQLKNVSESTETKGRLGLCQYHECHIKYLCGVALLLYILQPYWTFKVFIMRHHNESMKENKATAITLCVLWEEI